MADVHSKKVRSFNMSRIRGKDTQPKIIVRKFLFSKGLRYKLHDKKLPGKPDLVFPKYRKVVFVHGCFWHGHAGCKFIVLPKTRTEWWLKKITTNKLNDKKSIRALKRNGWTVITVWECSLKAGKKKATLNSLINKFYILKDKNKYLCN